jgi:subtilase family serine protease
LTHAIAPFAKILLVEAIDNSLVHLLYAVDYARSRPDVVAISMSWGGDERPEEANYDTHFTSSYGASFFVASGDSGASAGPSYPAVSPNVIAVDGTNLVFNPDGSFSSETAWSGSGGGISQYEPEPQYQLSYGVPNANGHRCNPDVSYNAGTGVSVYDSTPLDGETGWWSLGGTSAGAPQWAAIHSFNLTANNNNFYQVAKGPVYPSYFRDIINGSNGYPAIVGL